jgi:hypothetical protein
MFAEINPGIVIGGAAAAISVLAALAALYLWAENRARQKRDPAVESQARGVIPWLAPLLLPTFVIMCLGSIAGLFKAYEERSWPEALNTVVTLWAAFMIFAFWLKIRKSNVINNANHP